jgi:hypothetical protein
MLAYPAELNSKQPEIRDPDWLVKHAESSKPEV